MATDYSKLRDAIKLEIANTTVRSPRHPSVVFKAMNALNTKFSGEIIEDTINPFPEQFFTCPVRCEACNQRCQRSMGHMSDGDGHMNHNQCNYQHQYDNKKYMCEKCYNKGKMVSGRYCYSSKKKNFFLFDKQRFFFLSFKPAAFLAANWHPS